MTLAQLSALMDGDRRFHDPEAAKPTTEPGTAMDLMMLSRMRVS